MKFFRSLLKKIRSRLIPLRISGISEIRAMCAGKKGIEIGGPSAIFTWKGKIPLYSIAGSLDACNFSGTTMWEGTISEGKNFRFHPKKDSGFQYICEASDLKSIKDAQYDFLLSSHVLEHCANPLKTLREWTRVLKDDGMLLLIVPHRDGTFDHKREITSFEHLVRDEEQNIGEDDTTHMEEFIAKLDLAMTGYGTDRITFEERTRKNLEFRGMHHHVFDARLVIQVIDHAGLQITNVQTMLPFHIVVVAQKKKLKNNDKWLAPEFRLRRSPFITDRN